MRLSHNIASLSIYREYSKNLKDQRKAINRISSGYKVNSASEDPNAISQSERLRIQIRGLQAASRNAQDGTSMLQTAEGGLDSITSILQRIKELTVQAGGVDSAEDKATIQNEINQMKDAVDDIAKNTEFNGVKLLNHEGTEDNKNPEVVYMPSGANVDEKIKIPMFDVISSKLMNADSTSSLRNLDVTGDGGVDKALDIVNGALDTVLSMRSKYGALENRFDSSFEITSAVGENIEKSESAIRDADIGEEMMSFAKDNILIEAGNALMAQTNKFPQEALRILENIRR